MSQAKRIAFQKFLNAMRKLSTEVNDSEICKRLEILMATSKDDLPIAQVNALLADPRSFDPKAIPEPYTQYVRHFIYMFKRNGKSSLALLEETNLGSKDSAISAKKATRGESAETSLAKKKSSRLAPKKAKPGKK
ncbi:hypothetical protein LPTSP4_34710 [Leptospira ryugenii]|uniref:Uncharacterized protein n=1 Tax=Leptospira ryugenii TaxID=1917863 RepID=A0A2P2E4Y3_9LEPT|nr:hypothetical protein [Leptospira ryugenii]GBF51933.1 hypothetical protein LPTSP4_34710 [Leptospira ryugenii]